MFLSALFMLFLLLIANKQSLTLRHSTKTAYLDSFDEEQLVYLNNVSNYKIQNCV